MECVLLAHAMVAERAAVVGGVDDECAVEELSLRAQKEEKPAELRIHERGEVVVAAPRGVGHNATPALEPSSLERFGVGFGGIRSTRCGQRTPIVHMRPRIIGRTVERWVRRHEARMHGPSLRARA